MPCNDLEYAHLRSLPGHIPRTLQFVQLQIRPNGMSKKVQAANNVKTGSILVSWHPSSLHPPPCERQSKFDLSVALRVNQELGAGFYMQTSKALGIMLSLQHWKILPF